MKTCGDYGGMTEKGKPCTYNAGWGMGLDTGPCKHHASSIDRAIVQLERGSRMPTPPDWLAEEAKELWSEVGRRIRKMGYLREVDFPLFAQAMNSYGIMIRAARRVNREGLLSDSTKGTPREHPIWQIYKDSFKQYRQASNMLGLSPNARSQIGLPEVDDSPESEMERILESG